METSVIKRALQGPAASYHADADNIGLYITRFGDSLILQTLQVGYSCR